MDVSSAGIIVRTSSMICPPYIFARFYCDIISFAKFLAAMFYCQVYSPVNQLLVASFLQELFKDTRGNYAL
jgi:hypothetical protein